MIFSKIAMMRKKIKLRKFLNNNKNIITISPSTDVRIDTKFDFKTGRKEKSISIGDNCIINGSFIFESDKGAVTIGNNVFVGKNVRFFSRNNIKIGNDVMIAENVTFYDHNSHSLNWKDRLYDTQSLTQAKSSEERVKIKNWNNVLDAPIFIDNNVWIGMDSLILKGVTIGEGAIIGARSVVTKDVAPYTCVAGNPAVFIKDLEK